MLSGKQDEKTAFIVAVAPFPALAPGKFDNFWQRHLISRSTLRKFRAEAMTHWQAAVARAVKSN